MDLSTKFVAFWWTYISRTGLNLCASNLLEYKVITEG